MRKIFIIGAGGFGREVAWVIERINAVRPEFEVLGFCDDAEGKRAGMCGAYRLLGPDRLLGEQFGTAGFFCAIGDNRIRKAVTEKMRAKGHEPVTVVDPGAVIAPGAVIGRGSYVGIGSVVSVGSRLGDGVLVNHQVTVGHDVVAGDFAQLCPGVRVSGGSVLGEGVLMGSNACTIPCVRVGAWATVGAGAAALRDIQDGAGLIRLVR